MFALIRVGTYANRNGFTSKSRRPGAASQTKFVRITILHSQAAKESSTPNAKQNGSPSARGGPFRNGYNPPLQVNSPLRISPFFFPHFSLGGKRQSVSTRWISPPPPGPRHFPDDLKKGIRFSGRARAMVESGFPDVLEPSRNQREKKIGLILRGGLSSQLRVFSR